ncbi:MAG TPA: hypothetical protein VMU30_09690 [Bacteroidota bacterium]|nr:hypothetical protein [Bacteroidota bacterium]
MKKKATLILRWFARICSVASIGLLLLFAVGEKIHPARLTTKEWTEFIFFPIGISFGMILSWWKEKIGGYVTMASLVLFYLVHYLITGRFPHGWAFLIFALPGLLFLAAGLLAKIK